MAHALQVRHLGEVHTVWKGYLECALDGTNLWTALRSGMGAVDAPEISQVWRISCGELKKGLDIT